MDKHEPVNSHDAIPVREPDEPYAGRVGQTRYERVHLQTADGSLRAVAVCRAINVHTHPELKAMAMTGYLHRLDDGRELAISFVYHDPDARKFALVVPPALSHLELKEWAALMGEIADDTQHPVPSYVRDLTTVLGIAALAQYLEAVPEPDVEASSPPPAVVPSDAELSALSQRERAVAAREREIADRERQLARRAEGLTVREEELHRLTQALEEREHELEQHEREIGEEVRAHGDWKDVGLAAVSDNDGAAVSEMPRLVASEGRSFPPPLPASRPRSRPPPLPHRPRRTPPPLQHRSGDEPRPARLRSTPPPLPLHDALVTEPNDPEPEVAPPDAFLADRPGHMVSKLDEDELWLFVQLDEGHASAFRHGADLVLQYAESEGYPVVVLSLVDQRDEAYAVRLALDGYAQADKQVLEHLSRSFRARAALYVDRLYIETVTVATLREGVAQAIDDKIGRLPEERPRIGAADAIARVLFEPPPLRNDDLPFGPVRREAPTTITVFAAVEQLAAWLRPDKLIEATLTYSVAPHVIDATIRRVVRAAIAFGVALPDELLELAVKHGTAGDEAGVVREQLHAFRHRVEGKQNDLGREATRTNWERLLAAATARGVEVDAETLALSRAEAALPSDGAPRRVFEGLSVGELKEKLDDPVQRIEAIRELCVRGHASAVEVVFSALESLRPHDVAVAVVHVLGFGDAAGDRLIEALGSPEAAVRQCAALGLGKLQLRRGLAPLVQQLEAEDQPLYFEIARAFGDFGAPALRAVVRAIPTSARPDRLVLALAHLANHGCAREVEKLENAPDGAVVQAARKAMARRARMEWEDLSVREQRTLTDASPAARLSQAFYAEASKIAI